MKRMKARDEIMLKKCSRISRLNSEEPIFPKPNRNSDSVQNSESHDIKPGSLEIGF